MHFHAAVFASFLAWIPLAAGADQVSGVVVKIVGQRVTINDAGGKPVTLSIKEAPTLKSGDKIVVTYSAVGDALRATQVTRAPN